jgi:hypothetical protein
MLFCITANYTPAAIAAMRGGKTTSREEVVSKLVEEAGGRLVSCYGTIQEGPGALIILEIEDEVEISLAGIVETVSGTGALRDIRIQPLLTTAEVTESREKAGELHGHYTAPGQK